MPTRQEQLQLLIIQVNSLPIAERVVEFGKLTTSTPYGPKEFARGRQFLAAGYAWSRIVSYLRALDEINEQRKVQGRVIRAHEANSLPASGKPLVEQATARVMANYEAAKQEVMYHLFALFACQLGSLLPEATRPFGYKIPSSDRAIFNSYKPLRNYFEHLENRLPGKSYAHEVVKETFEDDVWRIQIGFEALERDAILFDGKRIALSDEGLEDVRGAIQRAILAIEEIITSRLTEHFVDDQVPIPHPREVSSKLLMDLARDPE